MSQPKWWALGVALSLAAALPAAARSPRPQAWPASCAVLQASSANKLHSQTRGGRALWIWETAFLDDAQRAGEVLRFARKRGVRTLFLNVPVWRLEQEPETVRCFLEEAHRRRFTVHALHGEPKWIYAAERRGAAEFLEALERFHSGQPRALRFDALHFDVEPQSLPEWHPESTPRLSGLYLDFLRWSRQRAHYMNLPLAVDVPPWYGSIPWENRTLLDAVLELSDEVALMAYADESWRIVIDSLPAVTRAEPAGKGVWIGLSADPIHLPRLPASRSLRKELEKLRTQVERAFPRQRSFRGTAIHDYFLYQRLFCETTSCASPVTAAGAGQ